MATVTNTVKLPDGSTPDRVDVVIELVASTTARAAGWITATDVTLEAVVRPTVTNGAWTASLTPNADITPSGTVYRVTEYVDKTRYIHYISVGSGGGSLFDLLTDAPASVASAALTTHIESGAHPLFNVVDYGALGDGATNDRAAFNLALAAATAAGGGIIFVPNGDYPVTSGTSSFLIDNVDNITIQGEGPASILRDAVGNLSVLAIANNANTTVRDISVVGTGVLGTAGRGGIWTYLADRVTISNVSVRDVGTCGMVIGDTTNASIDLCTVDNTAEHGIYISNGDDARVSRCKVTDAGQNGGVSTVVGIKLYNSDRPRVEDCVISGSLTEGIIVDTCTDAQIVGGDIRSNTQRGVRILANSTRTRVSGVVMASNATGEIRDFGSTSALVDSCAFVSSAPTGSVVKVDSGATGFEMRDCEIAAGPSGGWAVDINGTGTRVLRNRIRSCDFGIICRSGTSSALVAYNDVTANTTVYSDQSTTKPLPEVTGSRGSNAALASLLTKLASLGIIVDATT